MRRLGTYLSSTMGEQRLTAFALLSMNRERSIDEGSILSESAASPYRKSDFNLLFNDPLYCY